MTCPSGHPLTPSAIAIWFCDECGASGPGEKSMACRACDYDMCMVCVADTVENDDDDDAHTAAHDHDAYVRPGVHAHRNVDTVHG